LSCQPCPTPCATRSSSTGVRTSPSASSPAGRCHLEYEANCHLIAVHFSTTRPMYTRFRNRFSSCFFSNQGCGNLEIGYTPLACSPHPTLAKPRSSASKKSMLGGAAADLALRTPSSTIAGSSRGAIDIATTGVRISDSLQQLHAAAALARSIPAAWTRYYSTARVILNVTLPLHDYSCISRRVASARANAEGFSGRKASPEWSPTDCQPCAPASKGGLASPTITASQVRYICDHAHVRAGRKKQIKDMLNLV
jgi:hypothetical protein